MEPAFESAFERWNHFDGHPTAHPTVILPLAPKKRKVKSAVRPLDFCNLIRRGPLIHFPIKLPEERTHRKGTSREGTSREGTWREGVWRHAGGSSTQGVLTEHADWTFWLYLPNSHTECPCRTCRLNMPTEHADWTCSSVRCNAAILHFLLLTMNIEHFELKISI